MNKISKKIVALATMAAFVLTLVPAAAFAADNNAPASAQGSSYSVIDNAGKALSEVAADVNEELTTQFFIVDEDDNGTTAGLAQSVNLNNYDVKVWAVDERGNVTDALTVVGNDKLAVGPVNTDNNGGKVWPMNTGTQTNNGDQLTVSFSRGGVYTLYAGVGEGVNVKDGSLTVLKGATKITVTDTTETDRIALYTPGTGAEIDVTDGVGELDLTGSNFEANGTDKLTVEGYVYDGDDPAKYQDVTISSGNPDVLTFAGQPSTTVQSDNTGKFSFTFSMNDNRNVPLTITSGDAKVTLRVLKETINPYDIDTTKDDGYALAGTDTDNWNKVVDEDGHYTLSDAVQFTIYDKAGELVANEDLSDSEPAATLGYIGSKAHSQYLSVTGKPDKAKNVDGMDFLLVPNGTTYTLKYVGAQADFVPGQYTVSVSLMSGDYAVATFNVAEFGTGQNTVLDMEARDVTGPDQAYYDITDEVKLGQKVHVVAKYIDENGIKVPTDDVDFGFNSDLNAIYNVNVRDGYFDTMPDTVEHQTLLGGTITVTGFNNVNKQLVQETLTIVDDYGLYSLEFDPTEGAVNKDNEVTVSVVEEDGDVAKVKGTMQAYVADQSNEDAVVTVDTEQGTNVTNGKGTLTIYASKATTVDVVVAVQTVDGQIYADTLEYTVGDGNIFAHHNVVMTIGSSEYVVDKQLFTMDAAPYVDSNWRTMVPIRALAEAFDATVTYDNDDRTVTIEYNDKTIVMTVDESAYTINGEEAEMDTEAVIKGDRTYVPVRFAAEAMGFKVTALYDENSSTASVVFQS